MFKWVILVIKNEF